MKLLNQLERKLYRLPIKPFFQYIVFAMAGIYALDLLFPTFNLVSKMSLFAAFVLRGEVWRLLTFLIVPRWPAAGDDHQPVLFLFYRHSA